MDLDLRLVRYFVAVAGELHFGRAAAQLHISQPALSKQIRRLEEQLGASLLIRDSRHVTLSTYGQRFLNEARLLLAMAENMQQPPDSNVVHIAHIFELGTSRAVADAYTRAHPNAVLVEHALDGIGQLHALLHHHLDVAILRVSPRMLLEHPSGWRHQLLRLEPFRLVGRNGDPPRPTASLYERPIEVFSDPTDSGLYNAHGDYLSALEREAGLTMNWLGTAGAFSHCLARLARATGSAFVLEFDSYAQRYAEAGFPLHQPEELQPYYPWSLAWRDEEPAPATAALLRTAWRLADRRDWQHPTPPDGGPPWLPADDPAAHTLPNVDPR